MAIQKQDFDRLMNQMRVKLPGASDMGIKSELFDVLHEFFQDSSSWTENITVPIVAATTDYVLTPAEGGVIIRLNGVVDKNNIPQPALMPALGTLSLRDTPNTSQTFTATVIKNVVLPVGRDHVPDAPDWLLPTFGPYIQDGVLGRMMAQLNKSYTDPQMAKFHFARFRMGVAMARTATLRRNTFGSQAWAFPQGFRSRTQRGGVSVGNAQEF